MNNFCRLVKSRWNRTPIVIILIIIFGFTYSWIGFQNRVMRTDKLLEIYGRDLGSLKSDLLESFVNLEINSGMDMSSNIANVIKEELSEEFGIEATDLMSIENLETVKGIITKTFINLDTDAIYKKHLIVASRRDIISTYRMYDATDKVLPRYNRILDYVSKNIQTLANSDVDPIIINTEDITKTYTLEQLVRDHQEEQASLKTYYLLIPKRILSDSDIFGIADYDASGRYQDNSKIVLIDVISFEDILTKYYKLSSDIDVINKNAKRAVMIDQEMESFLFMISAIVLSVVFGVILVIDHTIKKCPHGKQ